MNVRKILLLFLLILTFSSFSFSQDLVLTVYRNLDFGEVFLGYSSNVLHTDPGAGKYSLLQKVYKKSNVLITFTLPAFLTNNLNNIPVTFDASHTAWSKNDSPTGRINFNPNATLNVRNLNKNDDMFIWLGGTINVPGNVSTGVYQNSILITAEFY